MVSVTNFVFEFNYKKRSYNGFLPDFFEFLLVFDQFKHEAKSVLSIIESHTRPRKRKRKRKTNDFCNMR